MTARIIDGAAVAEAIETGVAERARAFAEKAGRKPGLSVILVGDDPASHVYVRKKEEAAEKRGLRGRSIRLPGSASQDDVRRAVAELCADPGTDGILVQLPLPKGLDSDDILLRIDPAKDVDGFHPMSVGKLQQGLPTFAPCTPAGVMEALRRHDVTLRGANAVVVGRSNIVGKPMAALLLQADATVTICHSRTKDLTSVTRQADILVAAIGRPGFITGEHVRPGAVVVDVGINRLDSPKDDATALRMLGEGSKRHAKYLEKKTALVGDVDFRSASEVASLITPVPGGVGPLTIAMLLSNTCDAAERRAGNT